MPSIAIGAATAVLSAAGAEATAGRYDGEKRYRHADGRYVWVGTTLTVYLTEISCATA